MCGGHVLAGLGRERAEEMGRRWQARGRREDERNIAGIPMRKKIR